MATLQILFSSIFFFLHHVVPTATTTTACGEVTCLDSPSVRFPFYLANYQPATCGRSGFNLSCNNNNLETILTLPSSSGDFTVENINYAYQTLTINDPDNCLPRRFLNGDVNLKDSPFLYVSGPQNQTFVGCSSQPEIWPWDSQPAISCLAGGLHHKVVFLVPTDWFSPPIPILIPAGCSEISKTVAPYTFDWEFGTLLSWNMPYCRSCEANGGVCGVENSTISNSLVQCYGVPKSGLSTAEKYSLGVGIPGILFIGFALCVFAKRRAGEAERISSGTVPLHQPTVTQLLSAVPGPQVRTGLDDPTIESYPKTQLGETWELPKLNDNTCPICLSEYQPKEVLRTIPQCNHYFHANCIDEWLRINITCPLCRHISLEG